MTIRSHDAKLKLKHVTHVLGNLPAGAVSTITAAPVTLDEAARKELARLAKALKAELATATP
jgi:hypothetical protein